jgi:mortality factor 4-like protein 1
MSAKKRASTAAIQYNEGDVVQAIDKGKAYPAKILKCQRGSGSGGCTAGAGHKYFIHFQGWHRKYDTWIDGNSIVNPNSINLDQQLSQQKQQRGVSLSVMSTPVSELSTGGKRKGKLSSVSMDTDATTEESTSVKSEDVKATTTSSTSNSSGHSKTAATTENINAIRRQKRLLAESDLVEDDDEATWTIKLPLPSILKRHLVDEWTLVANDPKNLIKLPRPYLKTVRGLVDAYLEKKRDQESEEEVCFRNESMVYLYIILLHSIYLIFIGSAVYSFARLD